jgi:hypothetical protein
MNDHKKIPPTQATVAEYDNLILLLEDEILVYDMILESLNIKQQSIIANNIERLRECVQKEHPLIIAAQENAKNLELIFEKLKEKNVINGTHTTLRDLIKNAPEPQQKKLENQHCRLKAGLSQISKLNNESRYLLNFSLEFTRGLIQTLLKINDGEEKLYNVNGHVSATEKSNKIVNVRI